MVYFEAILALFAIVDPIGNIPILLDVTHHVPNGQSRKAFNTACLVGVIILVIFSFAGKQILNHIFHIGLPALQIAGGVLLLIIAIDHLIFGTLRRSIAVNGTFGPVEVGSVPLACPLLAGPGAMVTSLTNLETHGPWPAVVAILAVFAFVWLITRFLEPLHKLLGKLFCTVFSKVMCLFIAAIGSHLIMSGIKAYLINN